jgi:hypothetical protein
LRGFHPNTPDFFSVSNDGFGIDCRRGSAVDPVGLCKKAASRDVTPLLKSTTFDDEKKNSKTKICVFSVLCCVSPFLGQLKSEVFFFFPRETPENDFWREGKN